MILKQFIRFLFMAMVLLGTGNVLAQPNNSFELKESKNDVSIYYKWVKEFPWGKGADRNLILYIDNKNSENVSVNFTVDIYVKAILHKSSGALNYCLPPDYEIKGKFKDLGFDTGLSWDEMSSDSVMWEINELKVSEYEGDCVTQSNWLTTKKNK